MFDNWSRCMRVLVLAISILLLNLVPANGQDSLNVEMIGSLEGDWWGEITGFATLGDSVLFSADPYGWALIDASNPDQPVEVTRSLPGSPMEIVAQHDGVVVARHWPYTYTVDISDPTSPVLLDSRIHTDDFTVTSLDFPYLFGTRAVYGPNEVDFPLIIDLSDPANMLDLDINWGGYLWAGAYSDSIAYLGVNGLYLVNMNEDYPTPAHFDDQVARELTTHEGYLYSFGLDSLKVFDISQPVAPVVVSTSQISFPIGRAVVAGNELVVHGSQLTRLSLTDPENPQVIDTFDPEMDVMWNVKGDFVHAFYQRALDVFDSYTSWVRVGPGQYERQGDCLSFNGYNDIFFENDELFILSDFQYLQQLNPGDDMSILETDTLANPAVQVFRNYDRLGAYRSDPADGDNIVDWYSWNSGIVELVESVNAGASFTNFTVTALNDTFLAVHQQLSPWTQTHAIHLASDPAEQLFTTTPYGFAAFDPVFDNLWSYTQDEGLHLIKTSDFTTLDTLDTFSQYAETDTWNITINRFVTNGRLLCVVYHWYVYNPRGAPQGDGIRMDVVDALNFEVAYVETDLDSEELNIWIVGNYLFHQRENRLDIVDMTDPYSPEMRGYYPFQGEITDIHADTLNRVVLETKNQVLVLNADDAIINPIFPVTGLGDNPPPDDEDGNDNTLPDDYAINLAYPNPFNSRTSISVELPEAADVTVTVYDVLGRQIEILANRRFNTGRHSIVFNAGNLASGMYFVQGEIKGHMSKVQKVILVQ